MLRRVSAAASVMVLMTGLLATTAQAQQAPGGENEGGQERVDIGGYGSFRYEVNSSDEVPKSITLRRFVLTTDARLSGRFQVYAEVELERFSHIEVEQEAEREAGGIKFEHATEGANGSELSLEQAWGQFNVSPALGIRFGAVLPPVGRFNLRHDDNLWNLPRRPLIDRDAQVLPGKAAWTEMGLGVAGAAYVGGEAQLSYEAYLLNGVELNFSLEQVLQTRTPSRSKLELEAEVSPQPGAFDGSNTANAFAGRVQLSPALGSEYAVSGYVGGYTPEWVDRGATLSTLGIDGRQKLGGFYLEGEALYTRYGDVDRVAEDFAAAALGQATETTRGEAAELETEIEIELTDLASKRYGFWVSLERPIALAPGALGLTGAVITPVARYERAWLEGSIREFDFANGAVTSLEREDVAQERWAVGLAFRPVPQAVFQLAFERNRAIEGALIAPALGEERSTNSLTLGLAVGF